MKSSCSNIVKNAIISDEKLLSTPLDITQITMMSSSNTIDINKVIEQIKLDAEDESKKIIENANKKYLEIISKANVKANEIIEDAKQVGYKEGYDRGYEAGYNDGFNEGCKLAEVIIEDANNYYKDKVSEVDMYVLKFKNEIIELALNLAREIINNEISLNNDAVVKCAEKIINKSKDRNNIILRVSSSNYKVLKDRRYDLEQYLDTNSNLVISIDTTLSDSDFILESSSGVIDGRLEVQLENIKKEILKGMSA